MEVNHIVPGLMFLGTPISTLLKGMQQRSSLQIYVELYFPVFIWGF